MSLIVYDYAIIGAGAAGLHLAQTMIDEEWFVDKNILIIEKDNKDVDDRTWSYWEKGVGKWDTIISKKWEKGLFNSSTKSIPLNLAPYAYKTLKSIDFYEYAKNKIAKAKQFTWVKDEVKELTTQDVVTIKGEDANYQAKHVFDSRIDPSYKLNKDKYYRILQHFKGWYIETEEPVFDPSTFVMMDYQVKWKNSTSFTYVLPSSSHHAIVEFTLFNQEFIDYDEYDRLLEKYIREILKIEKYSIQKVEYGVIPMSDFPFHKANQEMITKIGTAGSWVKPSSGYAFKNIEKMAGLVVENLKHNRPPDKDLLNKRFRFYDTLYLHVFANENELGEEIFETMFSKNSVQQIFKFLDEETSLWEEFKITNSFNPTPFLKALLYYGTRIKL